ncbi:hypothetical protein B0H19DRAFT_428640 [Mycena capillaripes]|nr:hypothetical protein B0H19DRAFT_428640 [Mycena capillaripes]
MTVVRRCRSSFASDDPCEARSQMLHSPVLRIWRSLSRCARNDHHPPPLFFFFDQLSRRPIFCLPGLWTRLGRAFIRGYCDTSSRSFSPFSRFFSFLPVVVWTLLSLLSFRVLSLFFLQCPERSFYKVHTFPCLFFFASVILVLPTQRPDDSLQEMMTN